MTQLDYTWDYIKTLEMKPGSELQNTTATWPDAARRTRPPTIYCKLMNKRHLLRGTCLLHSVPFGRTSASERGRKQNPGQNSNGSTTFHGSVLEYIFRFDDSPSPCNPHSACFPASSDTHEARFVVSSRGVPPISSCSSSLLLPSDPTPPRECVLYLSFLWAYVSFVLEQTVKCPSAAGDNLMHGSKPTHQTC